jgi:hypothetical protein
LNAQRAEQERLAGLTAATAAGKSKGRKKKTGGARSQQKQENQSTIQQTLLDV